MKFMNPNQKDQTCKMIKSFKKKILFYWECCSQITCKHKFIVMMKNSKKASAEVVKFVATVSGNVSAIYSESLIIIFSANIRLILGP